MLDSFLCGLLLPIILPVYKFWVDQKIDPILFGYGVGGYALLTLIYYQALDWWQARRRAALNDPSYLAVISYPMVIIASILGYVPALLYVHIGADGFYIIAIGTGSFYYFCVRNHLRYLKRRLFTLEERELFDRESDKIGHVASIGSILLLACFAVEPARQDPVIALIIYYLVADFGALTGFTYCYLTLDKQPAVKNNAETEFGHTETCV